MILNEVLDTPVHTLADETSATNLAHSIQLRWMILHTQLILVVE